MFYAFYIFNTVAFETHKYPVMHVFYASYLVVAWTFYFHAFMPWPLSLIISHEGIDLSFNA